MCTLITPQIALKQVCSIFQLQNRFSNVEFIIFVDPHWFSNPFTRGSYTYDNLLKHDYPNGRAILGEPLLDVTGSPKVLFAGEATDLKHFSTVHGASQSGYREAARLLGHEK